MKLSTKARYGTRLMMDLAKHFSEGKPVLLSNVSKRQDVSVKYLEKLIRPLKKAKLVKSFRGAKGGYMLSKAPSRIRLIDIYSVLEGSTSIVPCITSKKYCKKYSWCRTRLVWKEIKEFLDYTLGKKTLRDLIKKGTRTSISKKPVKANLS